MSETKTVEVEKALKGLGDYIDYHGGIHDDGCPEDDTCDCTGKPLNDGVNFCYQFLKSLRRSPAPSRAETPTEMMWSEHPIAGGPQVLCELPAELQAAPSPAGEAARDTAKSAYDYFVVGIETLLEKWKIRAADGNWHGWEGPAATEKCAEDLAMLSVCSPIDNSQAELSRLTSALAQVTAQRDELWDAIREAEWSSQPNRTYAILGDVMEKHGVSKGSPTDERKWNEQIMSPFTQEHFEGRCFGCGNQESEGHNDKCAIKHGPFPRLGEPRPRVPQRTE
jgi:hypothetical protein